MYILRLGQDCNYDCEYDDDDDDDDDSYILIPAATKWWVATRNVRAQIWQVS